MSVRRWCVSSLTLVPSSAELAPPHAQPVHDAGPRALADARDAAVLAAVVEHAHLVAVGDAARGGVGGLDLEHRLLLDRAQALDVDEGRVEEVARRRRDHRQREAPRELGRAAHALVGRHVVGQADAGRRRTARGRRASGSRRRRTAPRAAAAWPSRSARSCSNGTGRLDRLLRQRLGRRRRSTGRRSPCAAPARGRSPRWSATRRAASAPAR